MPFPVVQPTTVASLPLGQPQPVLASQQVRVWLLLKSIFPVPCFTLPLALPCLALAHICSTFEVLETMKLPDERLRDGAKGIGFKGWKSNKPENNCVIPWNVLMEFKTSVLLWLNRLEAWLLTFY